MRWLGYVFNGQVCEYGQRPVSLADTAGVSVDSEIQILRCFTFLECVTEVKL